MFASRTLLHRHVELVIECTAYCPFVWGNLAGQVTDQGADRSIPARAGEPTSSMKSWTAPSVYPRACGGIVRCSFSASTQTGLSPRVRGNLAPAARRRFHQRSIPARAGFHSGASTRGNLLRWGSCSVALATPTGSDCPGAPPEAAEPLRGRCCPDLACEWRGRLRAPGVEIGPGGAVQTVNVGRLLSRSR